MRILSVKEMKGIIGGTAETCIPGWCGLRNVPVSTTQAPSTGEFLNDSPYTIYRKACMCCMSSPIPGQYLEWDMIACTGTPQPPGGA